MMTMSAGTRTKWMTSRRVAPQIGADVTSGAYRCDECEQAATAISHQGKGTTPRVLCRTHFLAMMDAGRAERKAAPKSAAERWQALR
jgi:hypothetical protein